jgi:hypothetical protein
LLSILVAAVAATGRKKLEQGAAPVGAALLQSNRDTKPIFKFESLSNPDPIMQPNIFLLSTSIIFDR